MKQNNTPEERSVRPLSPTSSDNEHDSTPLQEKLARPLEANQFVEEPAKPSESPEYTRRYKKKLTKFERALEKVKDAFPGFPDPGSHHAKLSIVVVRIIDEGGA